MSFGRATIRTQALPCGSYFPGPGQFEIGKGNGTADTRFRATFANRGIEFGAGLTSDRIGLHGFDRLPFRFSHIRGQDNAAHQQAHEQDRLHGALKFALHCHPKWPGCDRALEMAAADCEPAPEAEN